MALLSAVAGCLIDDMGHGQADHIRLRVNCPALGRDVAMTRILPGLVLMMATPAMAQGVSMETIPAQGQDGALALYPGERAPKNGSEEQWSHMHMQIRANRTDNIMVRNVVRPTITPYLPDPSKATGAAVIVAPGGRISLALHERRGQ